MTHEWQCFLKSTADLFSVILIDIQWQQKQNMAKECVHCHSCLERDVERVVFCMAECQRLYCRPCIESKCLVMHSNRYLVVRHSQIIEVYVSAVRLLVVGPFNWSLVHRKTWGWPSRIPALGSGHWSKCRPSNTANSWIWSEDKTKRSESCAKYNDTELCGQ